MLGLLALVGGEITLFKGLDEMKRLAADGSYSVPALLTITLTKLAALVIAAASGFRGGRIFPAVFVGVALGLMLHQHVPSAGGDHRLLRHHGAGAGGHARRLAQPVHGGSGGAGSAPAAGLVHRDAARPAGAGGQTADAGESPAAAARRLGQRERRDGGGRRRGGVEHRHRRIPLTSKAYFGAAENNPLRALLLQIADDPAILVARGIANFTEHSSS